LCLIRAIALVFRFRPDFIISTGALPGFFCILTGRLTGARTIWLDSVANAEQLSMCGKFSTRVANVCLTQWEHLAMPQGPYFAGNLL
jgi:UDP-N-acetylglucosamine:LPS N-acetylglucosamine transferase